MTSMIVLEQLPAAPSRRRELAHRCGAGIDVTLYWDVEAQITAIEVVDLAAGENFELEVPRARALDAFNHPFAYFAWRHAGEPADAFGKLVR